VPIAADAGWPIPQQNVVDCSNTIDLGTIERSLIRFQNHFAHAELAVIRHRDQPNLVG